MSFRGPRAARGPRNLLLFQRGRKSRFLASLGMTISLFQRIYDPRHELTMTNCSEGSDGRQSLFNDTAIEEMQGTFGVMGVARVVRDHTDGRAIGVKLLQQIHHRVPVLGV